MLERLRLGNKAVGKKEVLKAIAQTEAKIVFVAQDADERVTAGIIESCRQKKIELVYIESMKLLGKACGIEVGAAVAAILK